MKESILLTKVDSEGNPLSSRPKRVSDKNKLGKGTFGLVRRNEITLEKGNKERKLSLAKKTFFKEEDAVHSFFMYSKLKDIGMKVPTTYRINQTNLSEIFMTNYETESQIVVTNNSRKKNGFIYIEKIANVESLIKKLIKQCELASMNRMLINYDCLFFLISPKKDELEAEADFVIGDFDLIREARPGETEEEILENNLRQTEKSLLSLSLQTPDLIDSLEEIFRKNLSPEQLKLLSL